MSSRAVNETARSAVTPAPSPVVRTASSSVTSPWTSWSHAPSPWCQLVDDVLPEVEQGRVDQGVLMKVQRSPPAVGRGDHAESAPALRRAEALLFVAGLEARHRGAEADLENVSRVGPGCVRLAVTNAGPGRDALEFARLEDARSACRVLVREGAFADVGDHLGVAMRVARASSTRRKTLFVEGLKRAEAIGERVRPVLRVERVPDLLLAVSVVAALCGAAEREHRT